jgi:methylamine utilization protein MauJ
MQIQNSQQVSAPPASQEVPMSTFSGEAATITLVPFFAQGNPRNTDNPKGMPGQYRVTIVLGRPGRFEVRERVFHFSDRLTGNSHIAITRPAAVPRAVPDAIGIRVRARTDAGAFIFDGKPNAEGYLGKLVSEPFDAQTFDDALRKAYHAVAPSLSNWSAHLDLPVYVAQVDATELRTGAASAQVFTPPLEAAFAVEGEPKLESEFLYYAGLYREALNSNSPAYRFLCLYKIIEGVRLRRNRLAMEAKASGRKPQRFEFEEIPAEPSALQPWLNAIYNLRERPQLALEHVLPLEVRGRRFGQIVDSKLMPLRNEVAHGILDSGEPGISIDDMLKLERVNRWLPLTRTIARRMLKNNFRDQFLHHLPDPPQTPTPGRTP